MKTIGRKASTKERLSTGEGKQPGSPKHPNTLQTLDRGLQALTIISQHEDGLSVGTLAEMLGIHRAIGYRLVSTLEANGLTWRDQEGQLRLGTGLLTLASRFEPQLCSVARPLLHRLAQDTRAAAFVSIPEGNECVAILVAEPEQGVLRIAYRVGSRHPLAVGAAGIAILAGRPEQPGEADAVLKARSDGFSVTRDQLQQGAVGVAAPVRVNDCASVGLEASMGVVAFGDLDLALAIPAVVGCARQLAASLTSQSQSFRPHPCL